MLNKKPEGPRLLHADEPPRGAASTVLPLIRPPQGLQSLFALHASPYVTQRCLRSGGNSFDCLCALPLSAISAVAEVYSPALCHESVAAASLQSQARAHICTASRSRLAVPPGMDAARRPLRSEVRRAGDLRDSCKCSRDCGKCIKRRL